MHVEEDNVAEGGRSRVSLKWAEDAGLKVPGLYDEIAAPSVWNIGQERSGEECSRNTNLSLESDWRSAAQLNVQKSRDEP